MTALAKTTGHAAKPEQGGVLDKVVKLKAPDIVPGVIGPRPKMKWLTVDSLRINRAYQRDLSERSVRLIRRMVAGWDWNRLKALTVFDLGDGTFEVLDGQHTAVAAQTHGGIPELPCLVTPVRSTQQAAADFVGLNTDRVGLTPLQIFWAQVAAGDEECCEVARGVAQAGGRIPKNSMSSAHFREGDVISIGALTKLAREGGMPYVRRVVELGVTARLAPIARDFIVAAHELIWGAQAGMVTDQRIVDVIRVQSMARLLSDARILAEQHKHTIGHALALVFVRLK